MAKKMTEETEDKKETTEKKPKKIVKEWTYDRYGGNVDFFTEGFTDGDILAVNVNGVDAKVVITDNHGKYAKGSAFKDFPAVKY